MKRLFAWGVVLAFIAMILACWLQGCGTGIVRPFPPSPTPGPTITQVAEITQLPHPPTRTLTPLPPTLFILPITETPITETWTPTSFPSSTATATATSSQSPTDKPSSSFAPTASATPTPTMPLMPRTGASKQELTRIAEAATGDSPTDRDADERKAQLGIE